MTPSRTSSADARWPDPTWHLADASPQVSPPQFASARCAAARRSRAWRWSRSRCSRATTAARSSARAPTRLGDAARRRPARAARGATGPPARPARSRACRSRCGAPDNADAAPGAAGRASATPRPTTSAAPAPPWPARRSTGDAWPPRSPAVDRPERARAVRGRRDAGLLRVPLALAAARARSPAARVVLGRPGRRRRPARRCDRAVAIGGAGWRARVLATVPSNLKNPAWLADQAVALADEAGLEVTVWDEKQLADGRLRRHPRRRPALGHPAAADPPRLHARQGGGRRDAHGGAGRQGHHLRHRRPLDQARRGDDRP